MIIPVLICVNALMTADAPKGIGQDVPVLALSSLPVRITAGYFLRMMPLTDSEAFMYRTEFACSYLVAACLSNIQRFDGHLMQREFPVRKGGGESKVARKRDDCTADERPRPLGRGALSFEISKEPIDYLSITCLL
jgi:hypothetical protein